LGPISLRVFTIFTDRSENLEIILVLTTGLHRSCYLVDRIFCWLRWNSLGQVTLSSSADMIHLPLIVLFQEPLLQPPFVQLLDMPKEILNRLDSHF